MDSSQERHRAFWLTRRSTAIPVGWTDREEALGGWFEMGRVRLVTTSRSPQAARYCEERRCRKVLTSARA